MGFSQGACLSAMITRMLERPDLVQDLEHPPLTFAVFVGGFVPLQEATRHMFSTNDKAKTPSLHILGMVDTIIPPERSHELVTMFEKPVVFKHPGSHFVPNTTEARNVFTKFIQQAAQKVNGSTLPSERARY